MTYIASIATQAKLASKQLAALSSAQKEQALLAMADAIDKATDIILTANNADLMTAHDHNVSPAMIDRLTLNPARISEMTAGIREIAAMPDPIGQIRPFATRPNGLVIEKMRAPLGVICMIYEARPNVTADAGALCFKAGNAIILRGGKEALNSSLAIAKAMRDALSSLELNPDIISVVDDPDRTHILSLIQMRGKIDLVIPRGGEALINFVSDNSKIPVIQHFKGVCHLYVAASANLDDALALLENGKLQRTGVCNALECLLVDSKIAKTFLPQVESLFNQHQVIVHCCDKSAAYLNHQSVLSNKDFGEEYLAKEIAVRVVDDFNHALSHIDEFGSQHTEVICTQDKVEAALFQRLVDASVVSVNASSRFSDGGQLGLGAEIGIATTKLHAYGPMGLESLTCEKYIVTGDGQVRE